MKTLRLSAILAISATAIACSPPAPADSGVDTGVVTDTGISTDGAPSDTGVGPTDSGVTPTDSGVGPTDSGVPADTGVPGSDKCNELCTAVIGACTGANAQFTDMADCVSWCNGARIPTGTAGEMSGNTLECRIYHAGVARTMPAVHCPHAGATGGEVCGTINFNAGAVTAFTRVDRMGMPAVSTALVGSARKNAYNDGNPNDDGAFAGDFVASLTALHTALDVRLTGMNLTPCSMTTLIGTLPECLGQTYAPGATVASLVVPNDAIKLSLTTASGFPNGRRLQDPVIDVTLAVLLLRVNSSGPGTCGGGMCSALTLANAPLNPPRNDVMGGMFPDTFPYLHPPHRM